MATDKVGRLLKVTFVLAVLAVMAGNIAGVPLIGDSAFEWH